MLVFLGRYAKKTEERLAVLRGNTLRVFAGPPCKLKDATEYADEEAARAALESFVSRQEKAGYRLLHRIEHSPWLGWVDELERLWEKVVSDARALNIPCDTSLGMTHFQRTFPALDVQGDSLPAALSELRQVAGAVRLQWVLGDRALSFRIRFEVALRGFDGGTLLWSREDAGRQVERGVVVDGAVENHLVDGSVQRVDLTSFPAWFLRHVRDDVMTFTLAELARGRA